MTGLQEYLIPYIVSQIVAILFLFSAIKNTRLARLLFCLLFLYAGCYNLYIGLIQPEVYVDFGRLALPFYRKLIYGWFSRNNHLLIPLIAVGQLLIGVAMMLRGRWVTAACTGAIIFLVSIIPLMVGSAFPFSVIVSIAGILIIKKDNKNYLWAKNVKLLSTFQ